MKTPHKHADLIKAWADSAEIEVWVPGSGWELDTHPTWSNLNIYRVKPEIKPNVVTWHSVHPMDISESWVCRGSAAAADTRAVLRIEIDHNDPANPKLVSATLEKP